MAQGANIHKTLSARQATGRAHKCNSPAMRRLFCWPRSSAAGRCDVTGTQEVECWRGLLGRFRAPRWGWRARADMFRLRASGKWHQDGRFDAVRGSFHKYQLKRLEYPKFLVLKKLKVKDSSEECMCTAVCMHMCVLTHTHIHTCMARSKLHDLHCE